MVSEGDKFIKAAIPAIRIAVAELLSTKYKMSQNEIAGGLGVTQAAVNKYLNRRYSKKIGRIASMVKKEGADIAIAGMVVSGRGLSQINERIDGAASAMYQGWAN